MINYLTSMLLPAWLNFLWINLEVIAISAIVGYLIGLEGGLWRALRKFTLIMTVALIAVALLAVIKENLPNWASAQRNEELSQRWGFFGGGDNP